MPEHYSQNENPLPIEEWVAKMDQAIEQICSLGRKLLETHSVSAEAKKVAQEWSLADRLDQEESALRELFRRARAILESIESARAAMVDPSAEVDQRHRAMHVAVDVINENLPEIEKAFLVSRHSALDLLRWADRSGFVEGSSLPATYRASYSELVSYTPVFKPRLEAMQHELLRQKDRGHVHEDVRHLLSALTRYNALADSARAFVRSIVQPPFELVFHDAETFQDDWEGIDVDRHGDLATEINDCCQLLLYDLDQFHRKVERVEPELIPGLDASLYLLPNEEWRVIFTVDEDPVFHEMRISLLRIVHESKYENALSDVIRELYAGWNES